MIYKDFQNLKLSSLGMGTMRLPVIGGDDSQIDEEATEGMVDYAMEHGINYYDTAWGYHGGQSEVVMGKVLSKYPRGNFYLASKFPGYDLSNMGKVEEIFEKQLKRCKVGYFDFYLFHNVCEMNIDYYLDKKYGIFDYLRKQKENGRIRHLGFSAHGSVEVMRRFLEAYREHMEFCQIQLNFLDWTFQNAKGKAELLEEYQIPIWVMDLCGAENWQFFQKRIQKNWRHCVRMKQHRPGHFDSFSLFLVLLWYFPVCRISDS